MSLYRVMVSGNQEYWDVVDVEADTVLEAEAKALAKATARQERVWANRTGIVDIQVEGVEVLEAETPKSSDLAWSEINSGEGSEDDEKQGS